MKEILHILLILFFSLTIIISCSSSDDGASTSSDNSSSTTTTDNDSTTTDNDSTTTDNDSTTTDNTTTTIQLSDIKANLSGKNLFITTTSSGSSSGRSYTSTTSDDNNSTTSDDNNSTTSTISLLTIDNNSVIDYGIVSNYDLKIDQVRVDSNNEYAYVLMNYGEGAENNANLRALNCTIFRVTLSNNKMRCIELGLVFVGSKYQKYSGGIYYKPAFQFSTNEIIYFRTRNSDDFNPHPDLLCPKYCIYEYNNQTGKTINITPNIEGEKFGALANGQVAYTGLEDLATANRTEIIFRNSNGETIELSSSNREEFGEEFMVGDYKSIFWSAAKTPRPIVIAREHNNQIRKSFIQGRFGALHSFIKSNDGKIYGHGVYGFYSILPNVEDPLISTKDLKGENSEFCTEDYGLFCNIAFRISNKNVIYKHKVKNSGVESFEIKAFSISDNSTVSLLKPNSSCTSNCYSFNDWFQTDESIFISMVDLSANKNVIIKIDTKNINFNSTVNQYEIIENLENYIEEKTVLNLSSTNLIETDNSSLTADILHHDNDLFSFRINFNKKMNYSDIELKVNIIDNSTKETIGFMPIWNNKTLHLVIDPDNGTSTWVDENNPYGPLISGTTYKVTLLGTAKDSDGNTLGSDVVKYITP